MKNEQLTMKNCVFTLAFSFFILHSSFFIVDAAGVKEPNVAGAFYPADKAQLARTIQRYMEAAGDVRIIGEPLVLIAPHAGYIYSGPVAAYGYKALAGRKFDTAIVVAQSHFFSYKGGSVYRQGVFRTPLGDLEIDSGLASALIADNPKLLSFEPGVFEREHSLEVELPFLQMSLKTGFKIVPVLISDMSYEECRSLAHSLARVVKDKSALVVVSTDLSHYKPYDEAVGYDQRTISYIRDFDSEGLWDGVAGTGWNVCGSRPVVTGMLYARARGADRVEILKYANSGDTAGDKTRVVGYLSAVISKGSEGEDSMLTKEDKKKLLEIARTTITSYARDKKVPDFHETSPGLNLKRGAFVTLRKKGDLRGCIGLFTSEEPLYRVVARMSIESSTNDHRFSPVTEQELRDIDIEISVLTEPQPVDDWRRIRLGVDGVIIRKGFSSGVFLPQVAQETGWDLETFLGQLCSQKAGLPWDCFRDPSVRIYTYQAIIFSENES